MNTPNTIPMDAYAGSLGGISVISGTNAVNDLLSKARDYDVDRKLLKSITEHVAVKCAKRIGKTSVRILRFMNQRQSQQLPRQGQTFVIASWSILIILQQLVSTVPIMI
ncbi:hypothetical protein PENFLA_c006G10981 [Penicillium flavigenum]|uniref:Uncharacterized protein n=1 Tax=Penicillium flavigenum TaxID=254877 RepID=A0A1V6TNI2_9EURO|nr:hypothetical protein PENFLA_c006G10981 [Penicillium flavigenum]